MVLVSEPRARHAELLEAALAYAARGWPVIPLAWIRDGRCSCGRGESCKPGKHPLTPHGFKDASVAPAQIRNWWTQWPEANVGLCPGPESGFVVLDVDPRNGGDESVVELERRHGPLPTTLTVETGGGGRHYYFHHPNGALRTARGFLPGLELLAGGGLVVAPPSVHECGRTYRFLSPPGAALAPLPLWLLEVANAMRAGANESRRNGSDPGSWIREGERNARLASLAGRLRRHGVEPPELEQELQRANRERCDPPLEAREVQKIARSIGRYPAGVSIRASGSDSDTGASRPSQVDRLLSLLGEGELFLSLEGEPHATVSCGDHRETWPLHSTAFREWLLARYFAGGFGAPSSQALQSALGILAGQARAAGKVFRVWTRLAEEGGVAYLDLENERWEAVAITAQEWRVVANPPVKFRRPAGLLPLPIPVRGGQLEELRRFIPLRDEEWRLLASWVLVCLRAEGPYPVLLLYGEQGSAKSTTARLLRSVVDPAAAPLRSPPKDARDLMIAATNGWVLALDNLSQLQPWLSDALCSLATGGGFATRLLYTDDGEKIFTAQRPVILNGIDEIATNGDLLDRAIVLYLPHIPEDKRRTEGQLQRDFADAWPRILGAALDALVQGLRNLPGISCTRLPRMADFALWGCAVAPPLGWNADAFLAAYETNREAASDHALEASLVAPVLLEFMEKQPRAWEGTAGELLDLLNERAKEAARKQKAWPKNPHSLSNHLRRLAPNLRNAGVDVTFLPRTGKKRPIRIENTPAVASPASSASLPQAGDFDLTGWERDRS